METGDTGIVPDDVAHETTLDPWVSIWTRPRATVRQLVEQGPDSRVLLLAAIAGIVQVFDRASWRSMGDGTSTSTIVAVAALFGPLFGIITLYFGAWLIAVTGRWLGGVANARMLRVALGWASVPIVVSLVLWMLALPIFWSDLFTTETPRLEGNLGLALLMMLFGLAGIVLGVWSFVLAIKGVAEVQGFRSAWRGLGNILLGGLVIVAPLLLIVLIAIMIPMLA